MQLFASCPRGLEAVLAAELAQLAARNIRPVSSGVAFEGDLRVAYAANLHSRIASRVLRALATRRYRDTDDLYRLAVNVDWQAYFTPDKTIRIDTSAVRSPLRSLNFATLRIKDGIVDQMRQACGQRPSVDTRAPDVRIWLFLQERDATLYLDLSGEPLFKRGWRTGSQRHGEAPLKENLAAGLLALAGWHPGIPLVDPFCGAGTILIEAACIGHGIAPGIARRFGFETLNDHDPDLWRTLRSQAEASLRPDRSETRTTPTPAPTRPLLMGSDIDARMLEIARDNAATAGLPRDAIGWCESDFTVLEPPWPASGFVITNPPYGERLEVASPRADGQAKQSGHEAAMQAIGDAVRRAWGGWTLWMLSSDPALPSQLRMQPRRRTPLYNGAIECRLFAFEVFGRDGFSRDAEAAKRGAGKPGAEKRVPEKPGG